MKYKYIVKNLNGDILGEFYSLPEIARTLKVSMDLLERRLKRKVNKRDIFKREQNKINLERTVLKWSYYFYFY